MPSARFSISLPGVVCLFVAAALFLGVVGCERQPQSGVQGSNAQSSSSQQTQPAGSPVAQPPGAPQAPLDQPAASSTALVIPPDAVVGWEEMRRTCRYIVVDGSGSMGERLSGEVKITAAKAALTNFIGFVPAEDNVGLFVFDGRGAREVVPLGHGPENRAALIAAINAIKADGGTPLGASINQGIETLKAQAARQYGYGELFLTIVTDGAASDEGVMNRAVQRARQEGIPIQTIGFGIGDRHALRQHSVRYLTASDQAGLQRALQETLGEID